MARNLAQRLDRLERLAAELLNTNQGPIYLRDGEAILDGIDPERVVPRDCRNNKWRLNSRLYKTAAVTIHDRRHHRFLITARERTGRANIGHHNALPALRIGFRGHDIGLKEHVLCDDGANCFPERIRRDLPRA